MENTAEETPSIDSLVNPELRALCLEVDEIKREALRLINGLSDDSAAWRPSPDKWSIVECLDHLTITGEKLLSRFDAGIKELKEKDFTGEGPFRYGLLSSWFIRAAEPPVRLKVRAPQIFAPAKHPPLRETFEKFLKLQASFVERFMSADGLDLRKVKTPSPVIKYLTLSIGQWFKFALVHERRHLWQAWQVRNHPQFPAGR